MQKNGEIIKCQVCGKEFYLSRYRIEKSKFHFCSKKCYNSFERPHQKENIISQYRIIMRNGRRISEHRFIVEQFYGIKLNKKQFVHHKNKNKKDNRIENLEIMTPMEHNKIHFEKLPKIKICKVCGKEFMPPIKHRGRNTICSKECWNIWQKQSSPFQPINIEQYNLEGNYVKTFPSIKDAAVSVNGLSTNIVKCLKGKIKSAYGYKWKYCN